MKNIYDKINFIDNKTGVDLLKKVLVTETMFSEEKDKIGYILYDPKNDRIYISDINEDEDFGFFYSEDAIVKGIFSDQNALDDFIMKNVDKFVKYYNQKVRDYVCYLLYHKTMNLEQFKEYCKTLDNKKPFIVLDNCANCGRSVDILTERAFALFEYSDYCWDLERSIHFLSAIRTKKLHIFDLSNRSYFPFDLNYIDFKSFCKKDIEKDNDIFLVDDYEDQELVNDLSKRKEILDLKKEFQVIAAEFPESIIEYNFLDLYFAFD